MNISFLSTSINTWTWYSKMYKIYIYLLLGLISLETNNVERLSVFVGISINSLKKCLFKSLVHFKN